MGPYWWGKPFADESSALDVQKGRELVTNQMGDLKRHPVTKHREASVVLESFLADRNRFYLSVFPEDFKNFNPCHANLRRGHFYELDETMGRCGGQPFKNSARLGERLEAEKCHANKNRALPFQQSQSSFVCSDALQPNSSRNDVQHLDQPDAPYRG